MKEFKAPWGRTLIVSSCLFTAIAVAVAVWPKLGNIPLSFHTQLLIKGFPILVVLGAALFTIRSYSVVPGALLVKRLLWTTRLPLTDLQSAEFQPDVMQRSIRTCGNGGLFSFSGWYYNKQLGSYRALVTDRHCTVVLRCGKRTIVVSPADPEAFAAELSALRSL